MPRGRTTICLGEKEHVVHDDSQPPQVFQIGGNHLAQFVGGTLTLRGHAGVAIEGDLVFTGFSSGTLVALRLATGSVAVEDYVNGISAAQVTGVLAANNLTFPSGQIRDDTTNTPVSTIGAFGSLEEWAR